MSQHLANILAAAPRKKRTRSEVLALLPDIKYEDGRTLQCHADECDINQIMAKFSRTGTISHVNKYEGVYADYSDFDFHQHTTQLAEGNEVFAALPAEVRKEFAQDPTAFFKYVNDPVNAAKENYGLPALAKPGTQLPRPAHNSDADALAASAAADSLAVSTPAEPAATNPEPTPGSE